MRPSDHGFQGSGQGKNEFLECFATTVIGLTSKVGSLSHDLIRLLDEPGAKRVFFVRPMEIYFCLTQRCAANYFSDVKQRAKLLDRIAALLIIKPAFDQNQGTLP